MPKSYSEHDLQRALNDINGGALIKTTARKYGIPRGTIQNRLYHRTENRIKGPGTVLTDVEENILINWLKENARKGFPRRKEDVQHAVQQFLNSVPRQNLFKNNTPGKRWYSLFLKRHPEIASRTPEAVTSASSKVSEQNIRNWFHQIHSYLRDHEQDGILSDPSRIYNGDETNFLLCPKNGKVLAERRARNVYEADQGKAKENLTVMFSFSASGDVVPPMIIYPYRRIPGEIIANIPEGIAWEKSDNGWMTAEVFEKYIENVFYPHLLRQGVQFPVVYFLDGHRTHMTYSLSKLCNRLDIIAMCLYPNATRILQPADVSVFKPLKVNWAKQVQIWRRNNVNKQFTRCVFADVLAKTVEATIKTEIIKNGFKACGLYPFDANAIDYAKCLGRCTNDQECTENFETSVAAKKIDLHRFKEIAGPEKFQQLQEYTRDSPCTSDFKILHDIFSELSETIYEVTEEPGALDSANETGVDLDEDGHEQQSIAIDANVDQNQPPLLPTASLSNFLPHPLTPVRSGKRYKEMPSFVISSPEYQDYQEKIIDKKRHEEEQKNARKQQREDSKKAKELEKMEKQALRIKRRQEAEQRKKEKEEKKKTLQKENQDRLQQKENSGINTRNRKQTRKRKSNNQENFKPKGTKKPKK